MPPKRQFYFIRHGQTDWNLQKKAQGSTDIPLNAAGRAQAKLAGRALRKANIRIIASSPLQRARATADIISEALGVKVVEIPALQECCFGLLEGKNDAASEEFSAFWEGRYTPDGAETLQDFGDRVIEGMNEALKMEGPALIVSHGAVWRMLRRRIRIAPSDMHLGNAAPVLAAPTAIGWSIAPVDLRESAL